MKCKLVFLLSFLFSNIVLIAPPKKPTQKVANMPDCMLDLLLREHVRNNSKKSTIQKQETVFVQKTEKEGIFKFIDDKNVSGLEEFLKIHTSQVNVQNASLMTPLMYAILMNKPNVAEEHLLDTAKIVDVLLKFGADVNQRSTSGHVPFFQALTHNNLIVLKQLLDTGKCDVNMAFDANGNTILSQAILFGNKKAAKMLLDAGVLLKKYSLTELMYVSKKGDEDSIDLLLEYADQDDINVQDEFGYTALHYAIKNGDLKIVKKLLDRGINPRLKGAGGRDPLLMSCVEGVVDVTSFLIKNKDKYNIDLHSLDNAGQHCLHIVSFLGCEELIEPMLIAGLDPLIKDKQGKNCLNTSFSKVKRILLGFLQKTNQKEQKSLFGQAASGFDSIQKEEKKYLGSILESDHARSVAGYVMFLKHKKIVDDEESQRMDILFDAGIKYARLQQDILQEIYTKEIQKRDEREQILEGDRIRLQSELRQALLDYARTKDIEELIENRRTEELSNAIALNNEEITWLKRHIVGLEKKLELRDALLVGQNAMLVDQTAQIHSFAQEREGFSARVREFSQQVEGLQQEMFFVQAYRRNIEQKTEEQSREIEALKLKITQEQNIIQQLKEQFDGARQKIAELKNSNQQPTGVFSHDPYNQARNIA